MEGGGGGESGGGYLVAVGLDTDRQNIMESYTHTNERERV